MTKMNAAFEAHMKTGLTTICRCWSITRRDGQRLGFTDHDLDLTFEGLDFKADTGLSASALQQSTGLSVDNTEAIGALSNAAVTEEDIDAGRYDGAEVAAWLVNWSRVSERWLQFRGTIGELRRTDGAFQAELRGLTEALNRPIGRVYQKPCSAVLGDHECRFDCTSAGYVHDVTVSEVDRHRVFSWDGLDGFEPDWFTRGKLTGLTGAVKGLWGAIKHDRIEGSKRIIELWEPLRAEVTAGDRVRLLSGCDKRAETCRLKFNNLLNFQGFPDIPGEDWMMTVPKQGGVNNGGSRR